MQNFPLTTRFAAKRCISDPHGQAPFKIPPPIRDWLFDPGSLTRRLITASQGDFVVRVLRQYRGHPTLSEQQALGLPPRSLSFIREVELICQGKPWVFARTVIPVHTLKGETNQLTALGTKPLGAALFSSPRVRRGPITAKHIDSTTLMQSTPLTHGYLWGRHSVFFVAKRPLLVNEVFLPESPLYNQ